MGNTQPGRPDSSWIAESSAVGDSADNTEDVEVAAEQGHVLGKETDFDESTFDEDDVVDQDEEDEEDGEPGDFRSSLVDVGRLEKEATPLSGNTGDKKSKKDIKTVSYKGKAIDVESQDVIDPDTGKKVETVHKVIIKDATLAQTLQTLDVNLTYDPENSKLAAYFPWMRKPPFCPLEALVMRQSTLSMLKSGNYGGTQMEELIQYLEAERPRMIQRIEKHLKRGEISFSGLWYLFSKGNRFYVEMNKGVLAGSVTEYTRYVPAMNMRGPTFFVQGPVIKADGTKFYTENQAFSIPEFRGLRPVASLDIQPMTKPVLRLLTRRGKMFERVAIKHHYMQYSGFMLRRGAFNDTFIKADGRVMVDICTFNRMNPEYTEFGSSAHDTAYQQQVQQLLVQQQQFTGNYMPVGLGRGKAGQLEAKPHIRRGLHYQAWPYVAGFSFAAKRWGELLVESLTDIQFDDQAYDRLVLPEDKKALVKALVEDNKRVQEGGAPSSTDVISGKGGGVIFLLHGSPGVGKTLTAEAIAEYLHYPLYSVSVGELGVTADHLETKLNDILELAGTWNAVVLIDEADIFLERRSNVDVLRNAMVGVFLRKLEYHQGVLFLTSNRVRAFDPAFNSRINVAIRYYDLTSEARATVWRNLLGAIAEEENDDHSINFDELAAIEINGREIRTVIRLALALARCEGVAVNSEHIKRTVAISKQFGQDLTEAEEW